MLSKVVRTVLKYKVLFVSLFAVSLFATVVHATGGPFASGAELDPDCGPTTTNCFVSSPTTNPAGANEDVQFDNNGAFGADTGSFSYNPSSKQLSVFSSTSGYSLTVTPRNGAPNTLSASGSYTGTTRVVISPVDYIGDTLIRYTNLANGFLDRPGSMVTGNTSGATGQIDEDDETGQVWLSSVSGTFQPGETITSDDGATATVGTVSIVRTDHFIWGDLGNHYGGEGDMSSSNITLANGLTISFSQTTMYSGVGGASIHYIQNPGWTVVGETNTTTQGSVLTNMLNLDNGSTTLSLIAPAEGGSNYSLTFPQSQGASGQTLVNDGNGNLTWATISSSGSSGGLIGSTSGVSSNPSAGSTNETWLGEGAGSGASTDYTVFLGIDAGENATNASFSNFIGWLAGENATSAYNSNFIGYNAGNGADTASNSIFIGNGAGLNDTVNNQNNSNSSILIGDNTSTGGYSNSIALGANATNTMSNQFLVASAYNNWDIAGVNYAWPSSQAGAAGDVLTNDGSGNLSWVPGGSGWSLSGNSGTTAGTNFIGTTDGQDLVLKAAGNEMERLYAFGSSVSFAGGQALSPNMFVYGNGAGNSATNASGSNFIGYSDGASATNASYSNFIGFNSGSGATNASSSNFIGVAAGINGTNASFSNFIGNGAGLSATNASSSDFIGRNAGYGATNANNSIFIGGLAGFNDTVDNSSGGTSILIGELTSTGGYSNSIALGANATNTMSNQFMIGSRGSPISDMQMVLDGSGDVCDFTSSGDSCPSDERLKNNITDLPDNTLDTLDKVRTVTFQWDSSISKDTSTHLGFIAQDLINDFPQVVTLNSNGYYSVNYAEMAPAIVESIRELDLKLQPMTDLTTANNSFVQELINWLGSATNGITKIFAEEIDATTVHSTEDDTSQLCVTDSKGAKTCITKAQLDQLLESQAGSGASSIVNNGSSGTGGATTTGGTTTTGTTATGGTSSTAGGTSGDSGASAGSNTTGSNSSGSTSTGGTTTTDGTSGDSGTSTTGGSTTTTDTGSSGTTATTTSTTGGSMTTDGTSGDSGTSTASDTTGGTATTGSDTGSGTAGGVTSSGTSGDTSTTSSTGTSGTVTNGGSTTTTDATSGTTGGSSTGGSN